MHAFSISQTSQKFAASLTHYGDQYEKMKGLDGLSGDSVHPPMCFAI